ncbi:MAG: bifunctional phosphoribosyl-AMP cyclohydrolase/phosphoribosyl-ATP diphosphatase HisIE [Candidatus Neomarinimicrobiota bacterium]
MKIDFEKMNGLVPAIVQDSVTNQVLMVGYMNQAAIDETRRSGKVTFYSRSKGRLWTKGETSGNYLLLKDILADCDGDALLVKAEPLGPVCHSGSATCFNENSTSGFLYRLEQIIADRQRNPTPESYTSKLLSAGTGKIAQKVGEEAVELIVEALGDNDELFVNEAADLLYHLLVLLNDRGLRLVDVERELLRRH